MLDFSWDPDDCDAFLFGLVNENPCLVIILGDILLKFHRISVVRFVYATIELA